jgi:hypothetical protein
MTDTAVEAQARVIYEEFQAGLLAATPLRDMARWVETGSPPPADDLRSAGLTSNDPRGDMNLARKAFVREWGFSIPCREAVEALSALGPLVEIGCGSGYWTALLRNAGLDVVATDMEAGPSAYGFQVGRYADAGQLSAAEAISRYPDRTPFCSWPSPGATWATEMVNLIPAGQPFAMILHEKPGTTGDADLLEVVSACRLLRAVQIPQFPGVGDRLTIHQRL